MDDEGGFLSRWSRRKASARDGAPLAEPPVASPIEPAIDPPAAAAAKASAPAEPGAPAPATACASQAPPAPPPAPAPDPVPTLAEARALTRDADFRRFVAPGVPAEVRNTALKTLFSDPHFNVMDGLDIYIDDYGRPDPLPAGMLRQLAQSSVLGLLRDEAPPPGVDAVPAGPPAAASTVTPAARTTTTEPAAPATAPATAPAPATATAPDADEDADLRLQLHDAAGCARAETGPGPDAGR